MITAGTLAGGLAVAATSAKVRATATPWRHLQPNVDQVALPNRAPSGKIVRATLTMGPLSCGHREIDTVSRRGSSIGSKRSRRVSRVMETITKGAINRWPAIRCRVLTTSSRKSCRCNLERIDSECGLKTTEQDERIFPRNSVNMPLHLSVTTRRLAGPATWRLRWASLLKTPMASRSRN